MEQAAPNPVGNDRIAPSAMAATTHTIALSPTSSPMARCRAIVIDPLALDRELLARGLAQIDEFSVPLAAPTLVGDAAADAACDVVVIRASAPGPDLLAEVAAAAGLSNRPRIVVLAGYVDDYMVDRLRGVGADAVVSCDLSLGDVLDLLRGGEAEPALGPSTRRELGLRHHLTKRELEILDHLADGLAPGQIAHILQIRVSTIRDHVKSLRAKLDCTSATQLVITAHRLGLVPHVGRPLR